MGQARAREEQLAEAASGEEDAGCRGKASRASEEAVVTRFVIGDPSLNPLQREIARGRQRAGRAMASGEKKQKLLLVKS